MKVELSKNTCKVIREEDDPKIYSESLLLHKVKLELIKQGYDVIKKRMWRDGHLVDDLQQYIRSRNLGKKFQDTPDFIQIWDPSWAIRSTYEPYNQDGEVILTVERGEETPQGFLGGT